MQEKVFRRRIDHEQNLERYFFHYGEEYGFVTFFRVGFKWCFWAKFFQRDELMRKQLEMKNFSSLKCAKKAFEFNIVQQQLPF